MSVQSPASSPPSSSSSRRAQSIGASPSSSPPLIASTDSRPTAHLYSRTRWTCCRSSSASTVEPGRISATLKMAGEPFGSTTWSSRIRMTRPRYTSRLLVIRKGLVMRLFVQQRFQRLHNGGGHTAVTFYISVEAVPLHEFGGSRDALEDKRYQRHAVLMGQLPVQVLERPDVFGPVVRRKRDAGQD